jgi:ABC-type nickel/cobalt efflux system permease component RcnA
MNPQFNSLWVLTQQGLLLAVNFVDDLALISLTRLGLQWAWLQWISAALLIFAVVYWLVRFLRYRQQIRS